MRLFCRSSLERLRDGVVRSEVCFLVAWVLVDMDMDGLGWNGMGWNGSSNF